jgi:hypothetical protein
MQSAYFDHAVFKTAIHTAFLNHVLVFMDMFSVFSLVDFQYDYIIIVNSRLAAPKLGVHITSLIDYYNIMYYYQPDCSPQSVAKT